MVTELTIENITEIKDSFINLQTVLHEFQTNPFAKYLIYKENNCVIGYIYYSDIYDRAEINQFEIELSHRNCGKGKILLEKMLELVDKNITLEVRINNQAAIHLYKTHGFVERALRKGYYQGIDGILMERINE